MAKKKAINKPAARTKKKVTKKKSTAAPRTRKTPVKQAKSERASARANAGTKKWQPNPKYKAVLKYLEKRPMIRPACRALGVSPGSFHQAMRDNPDFDEQVKEAQRIGWEHAEHEALRRAAEGVEEYVVAGGKVVMKTHDDDGKPLDTPIPLKRRVYSDKLLTDILKGNLKEKYGTQQHEHSGKGGGPIKQETQYILLGEQQTKDLPDDILEQAAAQAGSGE